LAIMNWYVLLLISPLGRIFPKKPLVQKLLTLRKPIGLSVALLALTHASLGFWKQLGGFGGILKLPTLLGWAVGLAFFALTILLIMAGASIDSVAKKRSPAFWRIFSKLGYAAGIAIIMHIWIIGTHAAVSALQAVALLLLLTLCGLTAVGLGKSLVGKGISRQKAGALALLVWLLFAAGIIGMRLYVTSYSASHRGHAGQIGVSSHDHP